METVILLPSIRRSTTTVLNFFIICFPKPWLPCKKFDMASHGNSMSQLDLVAVWTKFTINSMTIPRHLSRFYLFSMPDSDMDFGQVQVMECPWHLLRKWWDFPCGFGLIFDRNQTAVKKTWCPKFRELLLHSFQNFFNMFTGQGKVDAHLLRFVKSFSIFAEEFLKFVSRWLQDFVKFLQAHLPNRAGGCWAW